MKFSSNKAHFLSSKFTILLNHNTQTFKVSLKEFTKEINSYKSQNFKFLKYLTRRYNIKGEFYPYLIHNVKENKRKIIIIKMFVYLIEKNFKDITLREQNKQIIETSVFFDYFNKIKYAIFNDIYALYQYLMPYFMILQIKAMIYFPNICFVTDIKSMFDDYHQVIFKNPYLFLKCMQAHFYIHFNKDFMSDLKFKTHFINSSNIIDYISLRIYRSFRPLRFLENQLYQKCNMVEKFSSPFIILNTKNVSLYNFEKWVEDIKTICLSVKHATQAYKSFFVNQKMFLCMFYLREKNFEKMNKILHQLSLFIRKRKFRFLHFLFKAIQLELTQSDLSCENQKQNGKQSQKMKKLQIFYEKCLEIFLHLIGDPRWNSKIFSYFFEFLISKLIKYESNSTKIISYEEILSANFYNQGIYQQIAQNLKSSDNVREDIEKIQNTFLDFNLLEKNKMNEFILYCLKLIAFNHKMDYYQTKHDIKNEYKKLGNLLYTWGFNNYGQLGFISTTKYEREKKSNFSLCRLLTLFETQIVDISFGYDSCLALDIEDNLYTWGSNNYGKLGLGLTDITMMPFPTKITKLTNIDQICCGSNHCLVLTRSGEVFAWGSGQSGELGNGELSNFSIPQKVQLQNGNKIIQLATGAAHSLLLDDKGNVYGFGDNKFCQIGSKDNQHNQIVALPTKICIKEKIVQIRCGDAHNICLSESYQVYTWGYADLGQCGIKPLQRNQNKQTIYKGIIQNPQILKLSFDVVQIYSGSVFSFVQSKQGKLYGFGLNDYYQLGIVTEDKIVYQPINIAPLNDVKIIDVQCGASHCVCHFNTYKTRGIYVWGLNKHLQLGVEGEDKCLIREMEFFKDKVIERISCGGYNTGVLVV